MSGTFIQALAIRQRVPYPETTSGMLSVLTSNAQKEEAGHHPIPRGGASGKPSLAELAWRERDEVHKG